MTDTVTLEKALFIIDVSEYNDGPLGNFSDLPGVRYSADRLERWATNTDLHDTIYNVKRVSDRDGPVTVSRVRNELKDLIDSNFVDRLVVYFAGHGMHYFAEDQNWLLTDVANNFSEAISKNGLRRELMYAPIGSHNPNLEAGQLCLISDACRNIDVEYQRINGQSLLSFQKSDNFVDLEIFSSSSDGEIALQLRGKKGSPPYCLFSELLIDGLECKVPDAMENSFNGEYAVTCFSLRSYLRKEVFYRSSSFDMPMRPDIFPGFQPPNNKYVYVRGRPNLASKPNLSLESYSAKGKLSTLLAYAKFRNKKKKFEKALKTKQIVNTKDWQNHVEAWYREALSRITAEETLQGIRQDSKRITPLAIVSNKPIRLLVPKAKKFQIYREGPYCLLHANSLMNETILMEIGSDSWMPIQSFPNTLLAVPEKVGQIFPAYMRLLNGHPSNNEEFGITSYWDDFLFGPLSHALNTTDKLKIADRVRRGKHFYPHHSIISGYLYESVGDLNNAIRTAHYMNRYRSSLNSLMPIDLAITCGQNLRWSESNSEVEVFVDLPEVEATVDAGNLFGSLENTPERPVYTTTLFSRATNVPVLGSFPIFNNGWKILSQRKGLEIPALLKEISDQMVGGGIAQFNDDQAFMLSSFFKYEELRME